VPCIGVHTPRSIGDVDDAMIEYVARQTEALVEPLEYVAGTKLDRDKLSEIVDLSKQCTTLWKEVLEAAANVPSPISFFDGTIQMGPAVVLRGTQDAIDYYRVLVDELKQRVAEGISAIPEEKFRIYWEGMPIWGKLRDLSTQFVDLNTCVVASTYCNSWIFDALNPEDPFRSMAEAYSSIFICRSDDQKEEYIRQMVEKYSVDGILYHDAKTCPNNSNSRYEMPQRLHETLGKPYLVINGDLNDLRLFSEEQTRTNLEAFAEQLTQV
jgi:benzoyl-CoA reductase/2-hydroxyglutaryl-CoA dehydratase subunit BcrC/BadD/HgdB